MKMLVMLVILLLLLMMWTSIVGLVLGLGELLELIKITLRSELGDVWRVHRTARALHCTARFSAVGVLGGLHDGGLPGGLPGGRSHRLSKILSLI